MILMSKIEDFTEFGRQERVEGKQPWQTDRHPTLEKQISEPSDWWPATNHILSNLFNFFFYLTLQVLLIKRIIQLCQEVYQN